MNNGATGAAEGGPAQNPQTVLKERRLIGETTAVMVCLAS